MSSDFIHRLSGRETSDGGSSSMLDSSRSTFFDALDSSHQFVVGDYQHNLEVLNNLANSSAENEVTEDRLIYAATHRFATPEDNYARRRVTVSRSELVSQSDMGSEADSMEQGLSTRRISRGGETRGGEMIIEFFRIFKGDDSYMEVSRDEIRRVRAMHKRFREGSQFSFNYNTLLIIASIIAGLGLGSNSTATIIASMLVSPLMGPVMGMAYGATIMDWRLFFLGLFTELVSLISCILVGGLLAGCMFPVLDPYNKDPFDKHWPTEEMEGRAEMFSFYLGIPIAFFSGLGVAVSVLDEQTSSLVGVAISASLLPPAVNAGMLWTTYFFVDYEDKETLWTEGIISLALTLVNIIMIILSSMLMFRAKERLPIKKKKIFWTDLGLARKIYQNQAIYTSTESAESERGERGPNAMSRLGRRMSRLFGTSTTDLGESTRSVRARTATEASGVSHAATTISRLSTVAEEERLSGYYSS